MRLVQRGHNGGRFSLIQLRVNPRQRVCMSTGVQYSSDNVAWARRVSTKFALITRDLLIYMYV